jgi:LacI family transcriptional regulator
MKKRAPAAEKLRIGVHFNIHASWLKRTLLGIANYGRTVGGWILVQPIGRWGTASHGDDGIDQALHGVVVQREDDARYWADRGVPNVVVSAGPQAGNSCLVIVDQEALGAMAADYCIQRGFTSLATFGPYNRSSDYDYARQRVAGFANRCRARGLVAANFVEGPRTAPPADWTLLNQITDLSDFMRSRPRPLALMPFDAEHANRAIFAAQLAKLRIPEDLAIVCAGEDSLLFESVDPTISGVSFDTERLGFEAAKLLHRVIEGGATPKRVMIQPTGVISRRSSSTFAYADPDVSEAVRHIWEHVDEALEVRDVAKAVALSERTLHRKFRAVLGRSAADEIRRARIETAKRLLRSTTLPLISVAAESGFASQSQMSRYIKDFEGLTPAQFRSQYRTTVGVA